MCVYTIVQSILGFGTQGTRGDAGSSRNRTLGGPGTAHRLLWDTIRILIGKPNWRKRFVLVKHCQYLLIFVNILYIQYLSACHLTITKSKLHHPRRDDNKGNISDI